MANTTAAANERLGGPGLVLPGDAIQTSHWSALPARLNAGLAEIGATVVISQEWPGGQCRHAGAIPTAEAVAIPIAVWAIPVPSDRHTALHIELRAWNTTALHEGRVTLRSQTTADEVTVVVGVGAGAGDVWTDAGALDIAPAELGGGELDVIEMYLETDDAGAVITVEQISAEIRDLSSPLAAQALTTKGAVAGPMGVDQLSDDAPLSTPTAFDLIDGDAHLRQRPNLAVTWSGLNPEYTGVGDADRWLPPHGVLAAHRCPQRCRLQMYARFWTDGDQVAWIAPTTRGIRLSDGPPSTYRQIRSEFITPHTVVGGLRALDGADLHYTAGLVRASSLVYGTPDPLPDRDGGPIFVAGLSLWTTHPVSLIPGPVVREGCLFAQAVTGTQLDRLSTQIRRHLLRRAPRQVHHIIDHERSDPPLEFQRPAPLTDTYTIPWTTGVASQLALVWIRYHASELSETDPEIELTVWDRDEEEEVDSVTIGPNQGLGRDFAVQDAAEAWPLRTWVAPLDANLGDRRPLALPVVGGTRAELRLACTNVRPVSVSILEVPRDAVAVES